MVIAAKSPLTGGYGDGNLGTMATVHLRKAGYDAIVVEGKAKKPVYLYIEDDEVSILSAEGGLWGGKDTFETERELKKIHGKNVGVLSIGPAGEHLVRYAVVISQEGRAAGRPGMGAVMGSKKLKAVVIRAPRRYPLPTRRTSRSSQPKPTTRYSTGPAIPSGKDRERWPPSSGPTRTRHFPP